MNPAPIFIVGFPRSGTTLLRSMLGSHPQLTMFNEPELIWALETLQSDNSFTGDVQNRHTLLQKLRNLELTRRHLDQLKPDTLTSFQQHPKALSPQECYERLLPLTPAPRRWGEKSLNNVFFLPRIWDWYPHATVVHLARDPRAAVASALRKRDHDLSRLNHGCRQAAARHAALWSLWMRAARHHASAKPDSARFLELRFEDLLASPEDSLRSICSVADLPFAESMLDHRQRADDPVLHSRAMSAHPNLDQPLKEERAEIAEDYPNILSAIVWRHCREEAAKHAYTWARPHLSTWENARLSLEALYTLPSHRRKLRKHLLRRRTHVSSNISEATALPPWRKA